MSRLDLAPWPHFDSQQIELASRVLASGRVNSWTGVETNSFESEFADWCGSTKAIAIANGSLALSAAYLAVGLGHGDELITTPRTFVATASSAVLLGAKPVFADVDPISGAITAATIAPLITPRTKAIAVVHLGGWPADIAAICDLARAHGISVIEDCAQAHGARINGQSVGCFGDVAAWSFCQDKIITTAGEGGMVSTSRLDLWDSMWAFKDHGKTSDAVFARAHPPGFRWLHERFGSNFRLTELQSAIGRIQLQRLPEWTAIRTRNALLLAEALSDRFGAFLRQSTSLTLGTSFMPSCSLRVWPMGGVVFASSPRSRRLATPPFRVVAARFILRSASRMPALRPPSDYLWPVNLVRPV